QDGPETRRLLEERRIAHVQYVPEHPAVAGNRQRLVRRQYRYVVELDFWRVISRDTTGSAFVALPVGSRLNNSHSSCSRSLARMVKSSSVVVSWLPSRPAAMSRNSRRMIFPLR